MVHIKGSKWIVNRAKPGGGFPFSYAWVNNAGIIEGTINKINEINKRGSDVTTQPCGVFASEAMLTGTLRWQSETLKSILGTDSLQWYHKLKLREPEWKPWELSTAMFHSIHTSSSLDKGTIPFMKKITDSIHEPKLFTSSSGSPLYFFFLREGCEYNKAMIAGRKRAALEVYRIQNHETAKNIHNNVIRRQVAIKMVRYCQAYFNLIADRSISEIIKLWNPKCKIKDSSPAWSQNVLKNSLKLLPKELDALQDLFLDDKNAFDVKKYSWKWWNALLENEYVPFSCRERVWNNISNWYTQMGISYNFIAELMIEAINLSYDKYDDCTHLVIDPSPEMGFSTNGRDSCGVTSSLINDGTWTVTVDEDKMRDVSRALTSALSIIDTFELTNYMNKECDHKLVIDGPSWANNFFCVSGADKKNADQTAGMALNLPSYGRVTKRVIDALSMASGELFTPFGNELSEFDEDVVCGLSTHVRTIAGDDIGLNLWDYKFYVDTHNELFPWTFPSYNPKQTLDYKSTYDGYEQRIVFNLGRSRVMRRQEFAWACRATKLIKTEQTPLGSLKARTENWSLPEYGKASFSEIAEWERPLWYCEDENEYMRFLPLLFKAIKDGYRGDIPESLLLVAL